MPRFRGLLSVVLLSALASSLAAEQRWEIQYLYDENNSTFTLTDLKFPSAQRGIASGFVTRHETGNLIKPERDSIHPVVLVTSDGGKKWTQIPVKEAPQSLYFLDDSTGWIVTDSGIWLTQESGRSWRRIAEIKDIDRVLFLTRQKGFAIGPRKRVFETADGGVTWKPVAAAAKPNTTVDWTTYTSISFPTPNAGLITGLSRPPGKHALPPGPIPLGRRLSGKSRT